jgi:hypothetical protein
MWCHKNKKIQIQLKLTTFIFFFYGMRIWTKNFRDSLKGLALVLWSVCSRGMRLATAGLIGRFLLLYTHRCLTGLAAVRCDQPWGEVFFFVFVFVFVLLQRGEEEALARVFFFPYIPTHLLLFFSSSSSSLFKSPSFTSSSPFSFYVFTFAP